MNRINLFRNLPVKTKTFRTTPFHGNPATQDSVTWGKTNFNKTTSTLVFAALLIVCSVAVDAPATNLNPRTQPVRWR